jgi:RNA polymerase sigma-70 factor (ECF subfamily)
MTRTSQQIFDEWLVACSQTGDKQAFERLVRRWQPRLLVYAERQLGNRDGAFDVVQDCLLTVAKGLNRLKDPVAFPSWIYRILHNKGCNWISTQQRQRRNDQLLNREPEVAKADGADTRLVQQGLKQLEREHYLTVYFFYVEEFSLHEISLIMDVPPGTVKSRLFTARKKLAELLK